MCGTSSTSDDRVSDVDQSATKAPSTATNTPASMYAAAPGDNLSSSRTSSNTVTASISNSAPPGNSARNGAATTTLAKGYPRIAA